MTQTLRAIIVIVIWFVLKCSHIMRFLTVQPQLQTTMPW